MATVTDIDGNIYETVQIGEQLWMKENLKVSHYSNGDEIYSNINDEWGDEWSELNNPETGGFSFYDNSSNECDEWGFSDDCQETFGYLYNWYAVNDERGVCPEGWKVPSPNDWGILTDYISFDASESWGNSIAGGKMKSTGTIEGDDGLWYECPNFAGNCELATNESEFTALPGGKRTDSGSFDALGEWAFFWTDSLYSSNSSRSAYIAYHNQSLTIAPRSKREGLVFCYAPIVV